MCSIFVSSGTTNIRVIRVITNHETKQSCVTNTCFLNNKIKSLDNHFISFIGFGWMDDSIDNNEKTVLFRIQSTIVCLRIRSPDEKLVCIWNILKLKAEEK